MKIKFYDGAGNITDFVDVVAEGSIFYYITRGTRLVAVPKDMVISEYYANSEDKTMSIVEFTANAAFKMITAVDFPIVDQSRTLH